jgi:hypothetical protein
MRNLFTGRHRRRQIVLRRNRVSSIFAASRAAISDMLPRRSLSWVLVTSFLLAAPDRAPFPARASQPQGNKDGSGQHACQARLLVGVPASETRRTQEQHVRVTATSLRLLLDNPLGHRGKGVREQPVPTSRPLAECCRPRVLGSIEPFCPQGAHCDIDRRGWVEKDPRIQGPAKGSGCHLDRSPSTLRALKNTL